MPGFDGTGPRGQGPMTGGGFGFCSVPAASRGGWLPRGGAFGAGRGRGWRNRYWITGQPLWARGGAPYPYAAPMDVDVQSLQDRANLLEQELQAVRRELARSQQKSNESAGEA